MTTPRRAFTLIELLVAMAVGLVLILVAMVAVRTVVQTATLANRIGLENRLMRQGVTEALDELDYWTHYDDPLDPARQPLRVITTMPSAPRDAKISVSYGGGGDISGIKISPYDGVTHQPGSLSKLKLGGSFTPLAQFPAPLENDYGESLDAGRPVGVRVRPVVAGATDYRTMQLAPVLSLTDTSSQSSGQAYELDQDRGFDPLRPYQANDPRRWFRGYIYETPHSDKRFGRYGMLMNLRREPMLGHGNDPREICSFARTTGSQPAGNQAVTGPYGPYPAGDYTSNSMSSRTWTWHCNQVVFLWEALGSYALAEYLPSGSIIASYGTRAYHPIDGSMPEYTDGYLEGVTATVGPGGPTIRETTRDTSRPDDNYMRIDERLDHRFSGWPYYWGYAQSMVYQNVNGSNGSKPATLWDASSGFTIPLLPVSEYTGPAIVGMPMSNYADGWQEFDGDNDLNPNANNSLSPQTLAVYGRMLWAGPFHQTNKLRPLENRSQFIAPLMAQKPVTWPDLDMGIQRLIFNGRFTSVVRIRWADPVTGEIAELGVTSVATSLRGARMQRKVGGGWAAFYGVNDPRNDFHLDSP